MTVTSTGLDAFVDATDRAGGPGPAAATPLWQGFSYVPGVAVDVTLDPDGAAYFAQMMAVYEEIAGRKIDQSVTEMTALDVDRLAALESPYADTAPTARAMHYLRLAKAIHGLALPRGGRVLDMGCGWGLSSEFLAQLGFEVVAVDINPLFADLVNRRAGRLGLRIKAECVSFEDFSAEPASFDAVLFYECFHHAVHPGDLLAKIQRWLKPTGQLILAGEPIQNLYWPSWGLRLDPLSVYCIRKFGWFESGWSGEYLRRLVARHGLMPRIHQDHDPAIGTYLVATPLGELDATALENLARPGDWWLEGEYLVSGRSGSRSRLDLFVPPDAKAIRLEVYSFRPQPVDVRVRFGPRSIAVTLATGRNEIRLDVEPGSFEVACEFRFVPWCPDEVLHNGDLRRLGFHLKGCSIES